MFELKLLAFTPFIIATGLADLNPSNSFIEYGALGICGFSVWMLFKQLSDIRQAHAVERDKFIRSLEERENRLMLIVERDIKVADSLVQALHDRPCLNTDSRINGG